MSKHKKDKLDHLNFITVEHMNQEMTFVYSSRTAKDAEKAFHELCHFFDGLGYKPCFIEDHNGNKIAHLASVQVGKPEESTVSDFWGGLFLGLVVSLTAIVCLI
jgi:hypothetical protein